MRDRVGPAGLGAPGRPCGQHQTLTVPALAFVSFVEGNLGEAQTAVQLPAILHALALGQWSQVIARLGLTTADLTPAGPTSLQDATIKCSDAWAAMNPATVPQQGPSVFAPIITAQAQWMHALCSAWPHDPGVSGTVRSTVPVVFLNGWSRCPAPDTGHWTTPPTRAACSPPPPPSSRPASPPAQLPGTRAPASWPRSSYHSRHPETAS